MRACKTSEGLQGGRFRNKYSSHKMYCSLLNHFLFVSDIMGSKLQSTCNDKGNKYRECHPSQERQDNEIITKIYDRLQHNDPLQKSRTENVLMSLSTGLYCEDDSINDEQAEDVGPNLQLSLDDKCYSDKLST